MVRESNDTTANIMSVIPFQQLFLYKKFIFSTLECPRSLPKREQNVIEYCFNVVEPNPSNHIQKNPFLPRGSLFYSQLEFRICGTFRFGSLGNSFVLQNLEILKIFKSFHFSNHFWVVTPSPNDLISFSNLLKQPHSFATVQ